MIEIRKTFSPDGMLRLDYLTGVAFSRESGAHRFVISGPAPFEGTVTASFMRADGQCVIVTGSLDEDGRAVVTADEDCYLVPGRMLITVYVTDGSVKTCVYAGLATVYDDRGSGEAPSGETTRTIEEMLEEILEGVDNAQQLLDDAGELLDDVTAEGATQVAAVQARGDQVIASIPSDYSTLTGEVGSLKSAIDEITDEVHSTNIIPRDNVSGYINENTGAFVDDVPPYYHTKKIPFTTDKTYLLIKWKYDNSNAFATVRSIAWYNASDECVQVLDNRQTKASAFTIPENAVSFATDAGFNGYPFGYFSDSDTIDTSLYDEYSVSYVIDNNALPVIDPSKIPTITPDKTSFFEDGVLKSEYIPETVVQVTDADRTVYKTANVSATATRTGYTYGLLKVQGDPAKRILIIFNSVVNCNRVRTMIGSTFSSGDCVITNVDGTKYTFVDTTADDDWIVLLAADAGAMSANVTAYDATGMDADYNTVLYFTSVVIMPQIVSDIIRSPQKNTWYGKNVLCIGDSLTHAGVWQQQLNIMLGMNVYTHALGGSGMIGLIDGTTTPVGTIAALSVADVTNKDLIIFFAGYNDRGTADGSVGDVYPTNNTIAGRLQYCINAIYNLLSQAGNLTCRLMIVTPHCAGKYQSIPYDGYTEYPSGTGRTMETLAQIMEDVAEQNSLPVYNAWEKSGINKFTWDVYSASPTAMVGDVVQDQLHLNISVGYPYLGRCITKFVSGN